MSSLRGKIITSYILSKVALLIFATVVIVDLHYLQAQIMEGEAVNAFSEVTQDIRGYEKNLFLYHDDGDYEQLQVGIAAAQRALVEGRQPFMELASQEELRSADAALAQYQAEVERYSSLSRGQQEAAQLSIRALGHQISLFAKALRARERATLVHTVRVAVWMLLIALFTVILLGIASAVFMARQIVRPLRNLELQLDALAEGGEQQLTLPSRDGEIRSFVHQFNSMLNRLRAQQNQLRQNEKAAALGVLVSGVAHELNNPLSNISTSIQLLMEDDGGTDPALVRRWMAHIDGESERARRIVRRLLDSVRQPKLHLQGHRVPALIASSVQLVSRQLPLSVNMRIKAAPERTVWVDRERFQQVFINLIRNAVDAGAMNIQISAEDSTWSRSMPPNLNSLVGDITQVSLAERVLVVRIDDDGKGISPDHLAHIFDPFFTTRKSGDGTGLGLYLVEEIVSEHYGCITAENRDEGGTRFTIWLPLAQEPDSL
ncbi:MAG: HAMP domain-containing histidine kinase [Xanthomonadaceae bacterium]|nr:HAMP domain-containing histidine kinase [Xanthomonadaceae bacterium]